MPNHNKSQSDTSKRDEIILTQGHKDDAGKPRITLFSSVAIEEISKVLTFGAEKYDDHNWRKGMKWTRVLDGVFRHLFAWLRGENTDPESGLSHLAHAGCGIMFLLDYEVNRKEFDDRYQQ
jgi:hypothetical protein